MPTCQNCYNKWTWKETMKKSFTLDPEMICPYCEAKQYQTQKSKTKSAFLNLIVLLPLFLINFYDISGVLLLSFFPVIFLFIMSFYPFLVEISSREEYINFFKNK